MTSEVIETLARAISGLTEIQWEENKRHNVAYIGHWRLRATALHAQIAPGLRAEGIEMAADRVAGAAKAAAYLSDDAESDALRIVADDLRAEAARLREGGEG